MFRRTRDLEQRTYEAIVRYRSPLPAEQIRTVLAVHDAIRELHVPDYVPEPSGITAA